MHGPYDIDYLSFVKNKKKPRTQTLHYYMTKLTAGKTRINFEDVLLKIHTDMNYFGLDILAQAASSSNNSQATLYESIHFDKIQINEYQSLSAVSLINIDYIRLSGKNLFRNDNVIKNGIISGLFKYDYAYYTNKKTFLFPIDEQSEDKWIDLYKTFGYVP